jgi:hypothetical protein
MSPRFVLVLLLSALTLGGLAGGALGAYELGRQVWTASGASRVAAGTQVVTSTLGEGVVVGIVTGPELSIGQGFWPGMSGAVVAVPETPVETPQGPLVNRLGPNAPNPFHRGTAIAFSVADPSPVRLRVFDISGRQVSLLIDQPFGPGQYEVSWTGVDQLGHPLASGVYFYRLEIGAWSQTRRMLKVR